MAKTFTAQLEAFRDMTVKNMRYVAASAIQDVLETAQTPVLGVSKGGAFVAGKMPVAEATLINSLSVDGGGSGELAYVAAIAGMEIGDVLRFEWGGLAKEYALPIELGWTTSTGRNVPGRHMVGMAAARFVPEFVPARVAEVKR